ITEEMHITHKGVSRLVMLDRYAFKDTEKKTLKQGDFVVLTVKPDSKFPARGFGFIKEIDWNHHEAYIQVAEEFLAVMDKDDLRMKDSIKRHSSVIDKRPEIYYEQIAKRNAAGLSKGEKTNEQVDNAFSSFLNELPSLRFIPAGRVLYGAGSETD